MSETPATTPQELSLTEALSLIQERAAARPVNGKRAIDYPVNTPEALMFHLKNPEPLAPIFYHDMCRDVQSALRDLCGESHTLSTLALTYPFAKKK